MLSSTRLTSYAKDREGGKEEQEEIGIQTEPFSSSNAGVQAVVWEDKSVQRNTFDFMNGSSKEDEEGKGGDRMRDYVDTVLESPELAAFLGNVLPCVLDALNENEVHALPSPSHLQDQSDENEVKGHGVKVKSLMALDFVHSRIFPDSASPSSFLPSLPFHV